MADEGPNSGRMFNCDETVLFCRILPPRTLAFHFEKTFRGRKQQKSRVKWNICANASGHIMLPIYLIGKRTTTDRLSRNESSWYAGRLFLSKKCMATIDFQSVIPWKLRSVCEEKIGLDESDCKRCISDGQLLSSFWSILRLKTASKGQLSFLPMWLLWFNLWIRES